MASKITYTLDFSNISQKDVPLVGGKNASLGEMFNNLRPLGINVPDGFAITADAYRRLLAENNLEQKLRSILSDLNPEDVNLLAARGQAARAAVLGATLPTDVREEILAAYDRLCQRIGREPELAVRSSATAEDLPEVSFAGQHETFLNVRGCEALLGAVLACFASLFTDRAISYRARHGFDHFAVALSVGVQEMVRSDKASAGVIFTLDPDTGFRDAVVVTSSYGLGEFVVQGVVTPDEWTVFKPTLIAGYKPIIGRRLGSKEVRLVYADGSRATRSEPVPEKERNRFSLTDEEVLNLARWACFIEQHYSKLAGRAQAMDIEWAKDGISGKLYVVQARPETVHSAKSRKIELEVYCLTGKHGPPLVTGLAIGEKIAAGKVRVIKDVSALSELQPGEVLVAEKTEPAWEPAMKRVAAIVTDRGGRTAHAAIVSREFGLPCIVGTGNATTVLHDGDEVTISCAEGAEGHVYAGRIEFEIEKIDAEKVPQTRTKVMLNVGDPAQAFAFSAIPNSGVGLARIEFIITNHIGIHPMALARLDNVKDYYAVAEIKSRIGEEDPKEFFVRRLSEGVGRIAAAFYPKPVIVRTSDFKTNEYARLIGGREFEPVEENPMLGFRGAARYYDERYGTGFALECAALARVRRDMGLTNLKVMIPFCRTTREAERVMAALAANGLRRGEDGLEVYAMCELPANVVLAEEFLRIFDGYSIGSNDLTQLVLGIDRDSEAVAHLFDERNEAVRQMIKGAIEAGKRMGKPVGICGQAPSDYPDFAAWLVQQGIGSISLNPDVAVKVALAVAETESKQAASAAGEAQR
ncbi:MAG TPA: phosphoenolpyruvate synthase [Blastocatellia bacterium]|nr:phosphoenolpyruvate synthase [Blastocatellia bacterium]